MTSNSCASPIFSMSVLVKRSPHDHSKDPVAGESREEQLRQRLLRSPRPADARQPDAAAVPSVNSDRRKAAMRQSCDVPGDGCNAGVCGGNGAMGPSAVVRAVAREAARAEQSDVGELGQCGWGGANRVRQITGVQAHHTREWHLSFCRGIADKASSNLMTFSMTRNGQHSGSGGKRR